jgi:hypothetical protein
MTLGEAEALTLATIPETHRIGEAELFRTKWFDYRLLHPAVATYYWAHCYREAMRRYCEMTVDRDFAQKVRAFQSDDVFLTREALACTIARQSLDGLGCRYEFALGFIMRRYIERGWRVFPRPNQLYSEELVMDIGDAWRVECSASLQLPASPYFRITGEGTVSPMQAEFLDWIAQQAKNRGPDHHRPVSRLLRERIMTPALATLYFETPEIERAMRIAGV